MPVVSAAAQAVCSQDRYLPCCGRAWVGSACNASVVCRGGKRNTGRLLLSPLHPLRSTSVDMGWVWHAHRLDGPPDRGMLNFLSGMIVNYLECARCACACTLCACAHVGNPWRVASACMVERHGVRPGVTSRTRKIQVCPCVNLCPAPTCSCVFVCVVLSKKKKKKKMLELSIG
jgi:hypothetical protein